MLWNNTSFLCVRKHQRTNWFRKLSFSRAWWYLLAFSQCLNTWNNKDFNLKELGGIHYCGHSDTYPSSYQPIAHYKKIKIFSMVNFQYSLKDPVKPLFRGQKESLNMHSVQFPTNTMSHRHYQTIKSFSRENWKHSKEALFFVK